MSNPNWLADDFKHLSIWSTTAGEVGGTAVTSDVWAGNGLSSWDHSSASVSAAGSNGTSGLGFKVDAPVLSSSIDGALVGGGGIVSSAGNAVGASLLKSAGPQQWNGSSVGEARIPGLGLQADCVNRSPPSDAVPWGNMPIRQDTTWDDASIARKLNIDLPVPIPRVEPTKPSDGTEIWRSAISGDQLLPGITANDRLKMNGHPPMWTELDRRATLPTDIGHKIFPPPGASMNAASWDIAAALGAQMWGDRSGRIETSLPLPDVLRHLSASGKFVQPVANEADFGVWSHSPPAAPPQPQTIDNGTAIWGNPPGVPTSQPATTARPPAPPVLPFNIDLSVPPPPLPKVPVGPPATAWNATSQMPGPMLNVSSKNSNAPQMRSRLLQQLLDMGFRKEDAQNAIIRNNMSVERTVSDLLASRNKLGAAGSNSRFLNSPNSFESLMQSAAALRGNGSMVTPGGLPPLGRNIPSPLALDAAAAAGLDVNTQRLLLQQLLAQQAGQQQQNQAVRQLICECLSLVTALRDLYQLRAVRGREADGPINGVIAQVEERVCEKVFGQLMCLPSAALSFDIKDLGYENGVAAAVDIIKTLQQLKTLTATMPLTPSPVQNGFSSPPAGLGVWSTASVPSTKPSTPSLTSLDMAPITSDSVGSGNKAGTASLDIKEFVPGRQWLTSDSAATAGSADNTPPTGTGLGIRRGSLADIDKVTVNVSSRLSSSEWSLDSVGGGAGSVAAGLKVAGGGIDPAASMPALWSPADSAATGGTLAKSVVGSAAAKDMNGALPCTLVLKSISDKLDSAMLRNLCSCHGRIKSFEWNADAHQATVTYAVHADALHAQRALNMCLFGDCHLVAEFQDGVAAAAGGPFVGSVAQFAGDGRGAGSVWGVGGPYEHGWSLGEDADSSASFLPAGLLNDSC